MRRLLLTLVLVGFTALAPAATAGAQSKQQKTSPKKPPAKLSPREKQIRSLLLESYDLGRGLPTEVRLDQLSALCSAILERHGRGDNAVPYVVETRAWSEEEFRLASELPESSPRRSRAMSDAATAMSRFSTSRAMQMLESIPPPPDGSAPDFRSTAAAGIFREMLQQKGASAVPLIRRTAATIGDSGSYPYGAIMLVLVRLHNDQPEFAQQLFSDALTYYERNSGDFSDELQFIGMLQFATSTAAAPQAMLVEAAREITAHIVRISDESDSSSQEDIPLSFLARRAQNTFEKIDPALAKQLRERVATAPPTTGRGRSFPRANSPSNASPTQVRTPRRSNQEEALMDEVMSLSEDGKADTPEMKQLIAKAFETGARNLAADLDQEDSDEHVAKRSAGGLELFVSYVAKFAPDFVIEEIQNVQDNEVKAFLLIEAARAMHEVEGTPRDVLTKPKHSTSAH